MFEEVERPDRQTLDRAVLRALDLDTEPVPAARTVIEFVFPEQPPASRKWWLIVEPDRTVDLCHIDPGFDV